MREILGEGKFLRLVREGKWEHAERTNAYGIVLLAAITDDDHLVLVEQYRSPVKSRVIELPAGLCGDDVAGEPLESAAGRELIEETGYQAREIRTLTTGPVSAGMTTEQITLFLATGLTKVEAGGGVEGEDIETHLVPLADVPAFLDAKMKAGVQVDTKLWSALWFVERARRP